MALVAAVLMHLSLTADFDCAGTAEQQGLETVICLLTISRLASTCSTTPVLDLQAPVTEDRFIRRFEMVIDESPCTSPSGASARYREPPLMELRG